MKCWSIVATLVGGLALGAMAGPVRAEDNAVIKGKVIFKGDPEKYKRTKLDTSKDANCTKPVGSEDVIVDKDNNPPTLRNVMVSIKEGLGDRKFEAPKTPAVLDQKDCHYEPHVLGVVEGQEVVIRNSDPTNHNIHFLPKINEEVNKTQPKQGMEDKITLKKEEPFKVKCDVHPWMGMYITVFNHPFFSVTDKTGTFKIDKLPPGKYVVQAWHEKFGIMTANVEVTSGETKECDFTFEPK